MSVQSRIAAALLGMVMACALPQAHAQLALPGNDAPASTDQQAEKKVTQSLGKQPALKEVKADVTEGVATLSGEVPTDPDRTEAADIAARVKGVEKVENRIISLSPDLQVRFDEALSEVKGKLVKLIANLPLLLVALVIVALSVWLGGFAGRHLRLVKRISRRNPYMDGLLRGIVKGLIVLGGVLLALDLLGMTSLVGAVMGSAGVVGLVLGFAFKDIAENYIAGVLLSIRRPFNPGDLVRIDSHEGRVVALSSRATQLMTLDGNMLQLPNSLVFKSVMLNYTRNPRRRFDFTTNVAAGQSWHDAMDTGVRVIGQIEGVLQDPAPSALIRELGDSSATLQFYGWIDQTRNDLSKTRSEAMRMVRRTLREDGIMPPDGVQRVVITRDDHADAAVAPVESTGRRDTSVDRALDDQLADALIKEQREGTDLLDPDAKPAPPATRG